jgi:uncharacterized protein GlcG (DUF336 family)
VAITLRKAQTILRVTLATGRQKELKPLTAVVLDAGGHVIVAAREDGASAGRFRLAEGKAYGAVMLGIAGTAQRDRAEAQAFFVQAMNGLYDGRFVPVPGGVLVRDRKGALVGAVGVTGDTSENDAACAVAGIEAAGFAAEA